MTQFSQGRSELASKFEAKNVSTERRKRTLEFKLEAVRWVKGGQDFATTSKVLGMPHQMLWSWLRTELARVKMERNCLKKSSAYFAGQSL